MSPRFQAEAFAACAEDAAVWQGSWSGMKFMLPVVAQEPKRLARPCAPLTRVFRVWWGCTGSLVRKPKPRRNHAQAASYRSVGDDVAWRDARDCDGNPARRGLRRGERRRRERPLRVSRPAGTH